MIDTTRLCDETERISDLPKEQVWEVVTAFRNTCLSDSGEARIIDPAPADVRKMLDPMSALDDWSFGEVRTIRTRTDVANSLKTPRSLKHTLRKTWNEWEILKGEVDFDDLLVCCALQSTFPKAFDFVSDEYGRLCEAVGDGPHQRPLPEKDIAEIHSRWTKRAIGLDLEARERAWRLICFLFRVPWSTAYPRSLDPPQGIRVGVCWDRIKTGRIESKVKDQDALRSIVGWKKSEGDNRLLERLESDPQFVEVFERLLMRPMTPNCNLDRAECLSIASKIFENALRLQGSAASEKSVLAFIPLWRLVLRRPDHQQYLPWVKGQALVAMRTSLQLANDIEYYWGSTKDTPLLSVDARTELRIAMVEDARQRFTAETLVALVSEKYPWTLNHFIVHGYGEEDPKIPLSHWTWIVPILTECLRRSPQKFVASVVALISKESRTPSTDPRGAYIEVFSREIDERVLSEIAPDATQRELLLRAIVESPFDSSGLDPNVKSLVDAVIIDAKNRLLPREPSAPDAGNNEPDQAAE